MFDSADFRGKGSLGVIAVFSIACLVLYGMSFVVVPGGFGYFLGFAVLGFVVLVIIALFGDGRGSSLIAKFR